MSDLTDPKGRKHILDGDGPKLGGGHRFGTGKPNKSEFPKSWSDDKILEVVSDIASDPSVKWSKPDARGFITGTRTVDGIDVKVVVDTVNDRIVTGYPTNTPRNP
jgi:filamentous hemagglutinin